MEEFDAGEYSKALTASIPVVMVFFDGRNPSETDYLLKQFKHVMTRYLGKVKAFYFRNG